jgi:5'-nucleotidase
VVGCPFAEGEPGVGDGACVLERCRDDVAAFERQVCDNAKTASVAASCSQSIDPCRRGGEECKFLSCLDSSIGNMADGRIRMVGR